MVKFTKSRPDDASGGPSSAIGIMRFFDADSKAPQLNPYFIVGISFVFIIAMLFFKMILRG